jgi:hypothetical protein
MQSVSPAAQADQAATPQTPLALPTAAFQRLERVERGAVFVNKPRTQRRSQSLAGPVPSAGVVSLDGGSSRANAWAYAIRLCSVCSVVCRGDQSFEIRTASVQVM